MTVELIYWDSDAFLGWLQDESGKVDLCQGTLERARAGEVLIVTSALTLAEVLWMRNSPRIPEDNADKVRQFVLDQLERRLEGVGHGLTLNHIALREAMGRPAGG